ncbi:DoxX family protein [Haloferula sargassicola]|uniref:DoxX family protein n=1 Tax=Haloferula sargassicola TaxID=490096 RepID=A0ABP9UK15_9BACT
MKKFLFECGTRDAVASGGLLVLRVGFGLMMLIGHGSAKIGMFETAKDSWPVPGLPLLSLMSPPVAMLATMAAEVGCSALLVLGLLTRPAAFLLGFTMLVAAFQVHAGAPFFMTGEGPSKEPAMLYFLPCLVLVISGAGLYSIDSLAYREKKRKFF